MTPGWRRQLLPIGVDVGADGIRLLQLEVVGDSLVVAGAARETWPEDVLAPIETARPPTPREGRRLIERLHRQGGLVGRRIAVTLPREIVQVKSVRLPQMPDEEIESAAKLEAQQAFGIDPDQYQVRGIPVGEVRQGGESRQEVLLLAVKNADVDAVVEGWHEIGFTPATIDFEPASLYRAVERFVRRKDDEAEVNVVVDVGHRWTNVVIGRGREINFYKPIDIGGRRFTESVARALGVTADEARTLRGRLIETADTAQVIGNDPVRQAVQDTLRPAVEQLGREIALCLRYYSVNFRGRRPLRVRVVGGEARDPQVIRLLSQVLPVQVEASRLVANADLSRMKPADRVAGLGDWTVAFGLSLKLCRGGFADRLGPARSEQLAAGGSDLSTLAADPAGAAGAPASADGRIHIPATPSAPTALLGGQGNASEEALHA